MGLISTARDGYVATITLDRPDARNALSIELCDELVEGVNEVDSGDARVLILAGAGRVFCSGADLAAVSGPGGLTFLPVFERMLEAVARCRVPTIAAIHGAALGGGLQLATVCDFRIAADDARLGIPSSRLGIVINHENVQRLVLLVGIARAKEILMTARLFNGVEAATAGIVTRSVAPTQLPEAVSELAQTLVSNAPLSVQGAKKAIAVVADDMVGSRSVPAGTAEDIDALVAAAYRSDDLAEGVRAMSERRPPDFKGR